MCYIKPYKYFFFIFLKNNQTNKGTDEEDQVEDQEIDTNHYDGNILHHQHKPHDETDKGEIINPPHYHQQTSLVKRYFLENIFCINDSRSIGARYFQRFSNCIVVNWIIAQWYIG